MEDKEKYEKLINELFLSKECAIKKCAKIRKTYYEIGLWLNNGFPASEIGKNERLYFKARFLDKDKRMLENIERTKIEKGYKILGYSVDSTQKRCRRLIEEINEIMKKNNKPTINRVQDFLDWLTYSYEVKRDFSGYPEMERGVKICIFHDKENRDLYIEELKYLTNKKLAISMPHLVQRVIKRQKTVFNLVDRN